MSSIINCIPANTLFVFVKIILSAPVLSNSWLLQIRKLAENNLVKCGGDRIEANLYMSTTWNLFSLRLGPSSPPSTENSLTKEHISYPALSSTSKHN